MRTMAGNAKRSTEGAEARVTPGEGERLWTVPEVAATLGVHANTVRYWARRGKARAFRQGVRKQILIPEPEVEMLRRLHSVQDTRVGDTAVALDENVQSVIRRMRDLVPRGSRIAVFGSYARGTAKPTSDLDVLVIEPRLSGGRLDEIYRIKSLVKSKRPYLDLHLTDRRHYQEQARIPGTLHHEIEREGIFYGTDD
jgi:excisionase family DNA binding protein